jgi:hypothetical protein
VGQPIIGDVVSDYLKAIDVFIPEFLKILQSKGLEVIDPNKIGTEIFRFDEKGSPTAMRVRATTAKAYKDWSGGHNMPLGGAGAELWLPIPKIGEGDSANLRRWMTPEYSGSELKESGQQGRLRSNPKQPIYGSGWSPEDSSVPEMGSVGNRGPQSGDEVQITPVLPENEDDALDDSINDKTEWPSHLDVTVKGANLKLYKLYNWLVKNGYEHEVKLLRSYECSGE